ncbi:MAG TPA: nicotinate-nucleotide adenylyltransferase [Bryobacteraceae bacterium]|jgi:nicotinate-nucleotide adenylyltransferase|nr:nicotinate-nucleotide adenylyltransferase [Bryobacteraceae bacterium]
MPLPKSEGQRVCLFGGTFDPIHCAHLRIADEAVKRFALDRVLFVPAGTPPHKASQVVAPYEDRLEMVRLACQGHPRFEASRLEENAGRSYTIDTVHRFRSSIPATEDLFFLIGADAFDEIETWKSWRELIQLVTFIVVTRPGGSYKVPPEANVLTLTGIEIPVSSSGIRVRLAQGEPTPELPATVRAYIDAHRLYK